VDLEHGLADLGCSERAPGSPLGILVGFLIFNIAYVTLVSNTLSTFEGNRYRFRWTAIMWRCAG